MRLWFWKWRREPDVRSATWEEIEEFARAVWTGKRGTVVSVPHHFASPDLWLVNRMIEGWRARSYQLQADGWYEAKMP